MSAKRSLACGVLVGFSMSALEPASAQSMSDAEKIERLQRQTEALERQLKELKKEIANTRRKTDKVEAVQASYSPPKPSDPAKADGSAAAAPKDPTAKGLAWLSEKVKLTVGGYIAAETVWRDRNQVADIQTLFNSIPYPYSPLYGEKEFHGSARQSRLSLLAEGAIDPAQSLTAYWESDFLGAAVTSNYTQSNSWAVRLRQAYLTYDDRDSGIHLLGGQAWSLLTQNKKGIIPRTENAPLTIDANYVVGFNYDRNWQVRLVKDIDRIFWFGVSIENPATVDGVVGASTTNNITTVDVAGVIANTSNIGSGFLSGVPVTPDLAPDIVEKIAWDPGWGHFEVVGVQRWFTDNTFCSSLGRGCEYNRSDLKTSTGQGVGGSLLLPVLPKFLDLQGSILYGRGIGRYGASSLPDVTIASDGSLTPITATQWMVGGVVHPWQGADIYVYYGQEELQGNFFDFEGKPFGWGNPLYSNAGCLIQTSVTFTGTPPLLRCVANTERLSEITVGIWQDFYKGDLGRIAIGAQWEYVTKDVFFGIGGAPQAADNVAYASLRYYPF